MSRQDRRGVNERGESPYGARARKAIMMDNPRLVPHVRSKDHAEREREREQEEWRENEKEEEEGGGGKRAERKKDDREKSVRDGERNSGVGHTVRACSAVFHHSGLCSAPFL